MVFFAKSCVLQTFDSFDNINNQNWNRKLLLVKYVTTVNYCVNIEKKNKIEVKMYGIE